MPIACYLLLKILRVFLEGTNVMFALYFSSRLRVHNALGVRLLLNDWSVT